MGPLLIGTYLMEPYNGHTMGIMNLAAALPFATVPGNTMAGCTGETLLINLFGEGGEQEASSFIFKTQGDLKARVIELGNNPDKMREVSDLFRQQRERTANFEMGRYARSLGALLRKSWALYCERGVCTDVFEDEGEIQPAQAGGASAGTTVKPSDSGSAGLLALVWRVPSRSESRTQPILSKISQAIFKNRVMPSRIFFAGWIFGRTDGLSLVQILCCMPCSRRWHASVTQSRTAIFGLL